jgi:hypothetical protein
MDVGTDGLVPGIQGKVQKFLGKAETFLGTNHDLRNREQERA